MTKPAKKKEIPQEKWELKSEVAYL